MGVVFDHVISFIGVISVVCLLIGFILLVHLIQQAFDRSGVIWGMIATIYPPGTYLYCRRHWDVLRGKFVLISGLLASAVILWAIVKLA